MLLKSIEIKNFRSLEDVKLEELDKYNVMIGRNNSGKSSVIGILAFLSEIMYGKSSGGIINVTRLDEQRAIELSLVFEPTNKEREDFIDLIYGRTDETLARRDMVKKSKFAAQIHSSFQSLPKPPYLLRPISSQILAEDGKMATVQFMKPTDESGNPSIRFKNFSDLIRTGNNFACKFLDLANGNYNESSIQIQNLIADMSVNLALHERNPNGWALRQVIDYFRKAFFFNPFRHSQEQMELEENAVLATDGLNLARALHTISSNNRMGFKRSRNSWSTLYPNSV